MVYSTAGIASFQLSFVKMAVVRVPNRVATVVFEGRVFDVSCNAFKHGEHFPTSTDEMHTILKLIPSFIISFKNTLVLA
jgi:hypothetical protein